MAAGAENDLAFKGAAIGTSKMRAEQHGQSMRGEFEHMARTMIEWREEGIPVNPDQVTWPDPIIQASWNAYVAERFDPSSSKRPLDPPRIPTDAEIEARALKVVSA